jgi:hypothetical protein
MQLIIQKGKKKTQRDEPLLQRKNLLTVNKLNMLSSSIEVIVIL